MSNNLKFSWVIKGQMNIRRFKELIQESTENKINLKNLEFTGEKEYRRYEFHDKKREIAITFFWYPLKNKLHFYAPNFSYAPDYCMRMVKKIYPLLKCGGYGNLTDEMCWEDEEDALMKEKEKQGQQLRVWSVNLFTPEEVKRIGRKKILNAPCELIEEWEDGAIFMMINKNSFSSTYEQRKKLREYLDVR